MTRTAFARLCAAAAAVCTLAAGPAHAFELDPDRGVLTLSTSLEPALEAVVQVLNYATPEDRDPRGSGSGAVIDAGEGLVLTNNHVVDNAGKLRVVSSEGRIVDAELVGTDPATDIALLRIPTESLTSIAFADSRTLKVGDVVLAVGFPFGLERTVTMGIISGLGRTGVGSQLEDFIQTDAPINSGNSGGPLLDTQGRIIGINTAIYSRTGGSVGIGFAVPTSIVTAIVDQLRAAGEVRRGTIGVSIQDATYETHGRLGAAIARVDPGSAAEQAGLRAGDVVVGANGERVDDAADVRRIVGLLSPGAEIELELHRGDGEVLVHSVTVNEPQPSRVVQTGDGLSAFDAAFAEMTSEHQLFDLVQGVVVAAVTDGGQLAERGVRAGDVVTQVNQTPVSSLADLASALESTEGRRVLVVARGNALHPVTVD